MSWFVIEIVGALAPFGVLLWWTARSLRRHRAALEEASAPPPSPTPAPADEADEA